MNFVILEAIHNGKKYIIEEDYPEVGAYLYIYDKDRSIMDYLQEDVDGCKQFAFENFGVPFSEWRIKKTT